MSVAFVTKRDALYRTVSCYCFVVLRQMLQSTWCFLLKQVMNWFHPM